MAKMTNKQRVILKKIEDRINGYSDDMVEIRKDIKKVQECRDARTDLSNQLGRLERAVTDSGLAPI